jgi:hypothetical protein
MTCRIYKYPVQSELKIPLIPNGHQFLHFGTDHQGRLCLWFEVDTETDTRLVDSGMRIYYTGDDPKGMTHVASFVSDLSGFGYHLYKT